ncbi:hypothetical protein J7M00_01710 [bacterium]|nr:hypothetical protein [bacterium]
MKKVSIIILAISFLLLAQNTSVTPGRVEQQIRITDRLLSDAGEEISEQAPIEARQLFEQAQAIQEQAWNEYENGNMVSAKQLTEQARNLIQKAKSSLIARPSKEERQVERIMEQNRELAEDIGAEISSTTDEELQNMYSRALELNKDAERMANKGDYSSAYRIAKQSQTLMKNVKKEIFSSGNADKISQAISKTDELIESISDDSDEGGEKEAIGILAVSRELQNQAKQAFENGDYRQAAKLTLQARKKAQQAKSRAGGEFSSEKIFKQIERTSEAIDEAVLSGSDDMLAASAKEMLTKARTALENGDIKRAEKLTQSARKIAAQLLSETESSPSRESVQKALSMTDELLSQIEPDTEISGQLYDQAKELQRQAQNEFEGGNLSESLKKTRAARELLNRIKNMR